MTDKERHTMYPIVCPRRSYSATATVSFRRRPPTMVQISSLLLLHRFQPSLSYRLSAVSFNNYSTAD
ncbi:predicted protein [Plenodomus lingam JN3]|uniref:Predicted protein n=1 Tax=Leptosphaeria maculans (strain JN3 / isolate v23.1.3 / race Av1-4-5-6-7-8) TaxID=985895 RepID=E4ZJC4_LEPMJ|nr:predicted protein [Plenodomus lingam JN3]CBX91555.1 predicted protein [Plenodomus lingam JN3]